ncbi:OLC1v1003417C3 [Oldenlandia corymbosa var. corymbosa]|uniref:OLC1v1003417C3 n=1 Tax=Oldenlandia corymbosa var. corymbosa TaxID=529605 RepID=A0AAV1DAN5_OLDCO|nr:OLC1v1003417C3 [Oldenlandia corymbosa var. corymbosa]
MVLIGMLNSISCFSLANKQVKEELTERIIAEVLKRVSGNETLTPELQNLALKFIGKVCETIYTGQDIKGEGEGENCFLKVALVGADEKIIESGPEASSEVEISVISDHGEGSQNKEMIRLPSLSKNKQLKLKDGVAVLKNVKFKHQSDWTKDCRMKLLARTIGNNIQEGRLAVKHAISESFLVRDHRVLYKKKPDIPLLSGEVGQLKGILNNKKLRELLEKERIKSVKDFLICYHTEPQRLLQMLGISEEKLMVMVDHAKKCKIPENQYTYAYSRSWERKMAVVFDDVGCIRGLINADHQFVPVDSLPEEEKVEAKEMVISAFQNWKDVKPYDDEASPSVFPSQVPNDAHPSSSATAGIPTGYYSDPYDQTVEGLVPTSSPQPNTSLLYFRSNSFNDCPYFWVDNGVLHTIAPSEVLNGTCGAVNEGLSAEHIPASRNAKGRWKVVIMSLMFVLMRKRIIVAPGEDSQPQKNEDVVNQ